ncbi:hypothetical protein WJT86_10700 [Microvirga sp. W0021]|uniref:AlgX/AlgJ SGNH hydrolase-like domain-containing protein n=1 Tax=Hohaiivirga grylli TaxID=3133970 RepID=A0ABV0BLE4_9HYPH
MKAKVYVFLALSFLITGLVPAINLTSRVIEGNFRKMGWKKFASLYMADDVMPWLGKKAYAYGLSVTPSFVYIGKEKWLYLADPNIPMDPTTVKRNGLSAVNVANFSRAFIALTTWDEWFKQHGVKEFKLMVGPDKESIYPEYQPDWAAPAQRQLSDIIPQIMTPAKYVDLYPALRAAKQAYAKANDPQLVYYRTDTHWNELGAWTAYEALGANLKKTQPDLVWLKPELGEVEKVLEKEGGDVSTIIYVDKIIKDKEVLLRFHSDFKAESQYLNYLTGEPHPENSPNIKYPPRTPTLIKTANALNHKKVLWLHDSFGILMQAYMEATFSEVLHIHPQFANSGMITALVKDFKPDYVLITTVERQLLTKEFFRMPPPEEMADKKTGQGQE